MISMIAAMTDNRVIGKNNELPWHVPEDLKWFKEQTAGKPVLMGRKTHESIGRVLKGRDNIVITNNKSYKPLHGSVKVYNKLEEAVKLYQGDKELVVIGGQQIYEQCMKYSSRIYLTIFHTNIDGDAFFPEINYKQWKSNMIKAVADSSVVNFNYEFYILERI
jgi:dihydrofolate reductase